ncbi:hypothetical protein DSO57_1012198 [Entomophthora muscae]|uniref:Uncharacterized protein n=1 Tax=Entomophthora muscae TaxID=34485 RepID=A0ACC2UFS5_9FUNG|nr:hypothetical protein DSO57_1012198 [Entomophthora muscae]
MMFLGSVMGSRFFDDLPPGACAPSILYGIEKNYTGLNECYIYSSLFFGTADTPCSDKCHEITVQASRRVSDACHIEPPNANNPILSNKERIYALWGNHDAAKVVCKGHVSHGKICLDEFSHVSSQLAFPSKFRTLNAVTPAKACTQCSRELHSMFYSNGYLMPVLYYQTIDDPITTFRNLGIMCGY